MAPLPARGLDRATILSRLADYRQDNLDTHGGRTWAYVYDHGKEATDAIAAEAYFACLHENGLDPTVFPSVLHLENELIGIAAAHLGGDRATVGNFTSGGTESCMLAVKAARDFARAERGIAQPELVLPETAHAAFHKAAHYFDMSVVAVPVDPDTFRVRPERVAEAINAHTALVVASAPGYAHGVVDPIPEIAAVCAERNVLLHVDACVGGWMLPYLRRLGVSMPDFDFSVPGVTSMSMDLHKFAYTPKGASLVLYRDAALRRHQLYACASWAGYTVINATIQSTKSAGPLAGAWATLHHLGDDGYLALARDTLDATQRLLEGVAAIPGLRILGQPEMSLFSFTADGFSVFPIVDEMKTRGWYVQPQLAFGCSPENIHLTVTAISAQRVEAMLADLRECTAIAQAQPRDPQREELLAHLGQLDPGDFTPELYAEMLGMAGLDGQALPARMADINAIMNVLPPALREQLLVAFLNDLYRPPQ